MAEGRISRRSVADNAPEPLVNRVALGGGTLALLALIVASALTMAVGMVASNYDLVYLSSALLASAIPLLAGVARGRGFDIFEPINLVAFAIFFGTTIRAPWLIWSDSTRVDFLMMGTTLSDVSRNCPAMLLSVIAFTLGYALVKGRLPLERFPWIRDYRFGGQRLWFAVGLFALLSFVGLVLFMRRYEISLSTDLLSLSTKRTGTFTTDEGQDVFGSGYERYLGALGQHALILVSALMIAGALKLRTNLLALAVLVFLSISIPFLSSSRTSLLVIVMNLAIFAYYYNKIKVHHFAYIFVLSVALIVGMGVLRERNQVGENAAGRDISGWVVGSGNSLDFVRTSAIMDRVPGVVDYHNGTTYLALFSAGIPRSVWPDKPQVALGPYVKGVIFGEKVRLNGWPSGLIAEGWINFGFAGLIIPLFLFGAFLRIFYESFSPLLGYSLPVTILYATSVWKLGFDTIGLNFAHGITQTILYLAPMVILLILARSSGIASRVR